MRGKPHDPLGRLGHGDDDEPAEEIPHEATQGETEKKPRPRRARDFKISRWMLRDFNWTKG